MNEILEAPTSGRKRGEESRRAEPDPIFEALHYQGLHGVADASHGYLRIKMRIHRSVGERSLELGLWHDQARDLAVILQRAADTFAAYRGEEEYDGEE